MGSAHYTPVSSLRLLDFRPASYTEVLMRLIGLAAVLAIGLFVAPLAAEAHSAQADVTQAAARALGLKVHVLSVSRADEFPGAFDAARKAHAEALVVLASSFFNAHRRQLVDLAAQNRLIAVYEHREFPDAGGLMSYGPNIVEMYRRAAYFVDKILKGASPADLPVEQPTRFELVINLKTAKALGLTIPQSVLVRADEIIQ